MCVFNVIRDVAGMGVIGCSCESGAMRCRERYKCGSKRISDA